MHKNHLQDPKKPFKIIFSVLRTNFNENLILKKKLPKICPILPKNDKITYFSNFNCGLGAQNGRYSAEKYLKSSGLPQILTKIFFIPPTQKLVKKFQNSSPPPKKSRLFFGGGGQNYSRDKETEVSQHEKHSLRFTTMLAKSNYLRHFYSIPFLQKMV